MYLFNDQAINHVIRQHSSGYFHQYRDSNHNLYYSTDALRKLLDQYVLDSSLLLGLKRFELVSYLDELIEQGCAMAALYDEDIQNKFGDLILRKKELWEFYILNDLGYRVEFKQHHGSSYWMERYGHHAKECVLTLDHAAPLTHIKSLIEVRSLSKGPYSDFPITNGVVSLSFARGEWYTFRIHSHVNSITESTPFLLPEFMNDIDFPKTIDFIDHAKKQMIHIQQAKKWIVNTQHQIELQLQQEFQYYHEWKQYVSN